MSVAVTTTSSKSLAACDQAGVPANAAANARQELRLRPFTRLGPEWARDSLPWPGLVAELRLVTGLLWMNCFNVCSSRGREHTAGSHDEPNPFPSAGMIRIRFNGFANRHLRFRPPRRCGESSTVTRNHGALAFGGSALCHRVVILALLQWRVSSRRYCARRSSPISPAMTGRL